MRKQRASSLTVPQCGDATCSILRLQQSVLRLDVMETQRRRGSRHGRNRPVQHNSISRHYSIVTIPVSASVSWNSTATLRASLSGTVFQRKDVVNQLCEDSEVLLYVHRNRRFIRDGSPGCPPRLPHSSWALSEDSPSSVKYKHSILTRTSTFEARDRRWWWSVA